MPEKLIFRCEVSTNEEGTFHVKTATGENLDFIADMIVRAYTGAVDKTTEALRLMSALGRR